ncbi:MAG: hypothetical protein KDA45_07520, partial [Planctomycetales bacterium]|nr:hypothetical protein [Planctomycetales bacterium]
PHQYRATLGYLQLIGHKQLTLAERWACLQVWLRFILQVQKWGRILKNTLTGTAAAARVESPTCRGPVVDIPSVSPLMLHL